MRVLLTNIALETRGGSELYLLDMARWLRRQGHAPVAYSARLGAFADTVRQHAIPVIADLDRLAEPPDLIHAQHHLPAMAALARFPSTPAVYFCHGWLPWDEAPLRHPAIRRYVAVSTATRERLVAEHGVPPSRVRVLPNFVDTERFHPRGRLPARPERALVFSNQAEEGGWVGVVRAACAARDIAVDLAGWRAGRPLDRPEDVLGGYDLVFARGRSALEAMAVGCAVILCDAEGLGPLVTSGALDRLGDGNFGLQVLTHPHRLDLILAAIDAYNPGAAAACAVAVRATRAHLKVLPRVFAVYEEALAAHAEAPHAVDEAHAAAGAYVTWLHREFPEPWIERREQYARTLLGVEARARDLAAEVDTLRAQVTSAADAARDAREAETRLHAESALVRQAHLADLQAAEQARADAEQARAVAEQARAVAEQARADWLAPEQAALCAEAVANERLAAGLAAHHAELVTVLADAEARHETERVALRAAHQAAMDAAHHQAARLAADGARWQAERDAHAADAHALRAALDRIQQGFLYRRLLPLLWHVRLRLLPEESVRYTWYRQIRTRIGRTAARLRQRRTAPTADPAETATEVPPAATLAAVVMDVGGRPETVEAVGSLVSQIPPPDVVVVSSGGGAIDQLVARAGLDVTTIQVSSSLLPGATRNVGLAATDAPHVGFLAGDCLARPGWAAGRLAAHGAGADIVSSAVVNHARWNPFAAATHTLLFGPRLPGTPPAARLHYGASYARELFARVGGFRADLRTGEDTEFRERVAGRARQVYRADVQAAHRNPTSLTGLLRDQFQRGRRTVGAREALYGGAARSLVTRTSLTRVPRSLWLTLRATPVRQWGPVLWALPWLGPAALAYAAGAATAPPPTPRVPVLDAAPRSASVHIPRRARLLCVTAFRNERRFLADFFTNVAPQVDDILALDDGSTDGSGELAAAHPAVRELIRVAPREPHRWNELRNRRLLVNAAARHGAEWVMAVDADERLERHFRDRVDALLAAAGPDGPLAYRVVLRELWDEPDRYRVDGVWGQKGMARLFRLRPDHDFGSRALHGHWAPENSSEPGGGFTQADLIVYHLRMIDAVDRERRKQRYLALDPDRRWQAIGYEYLTDPAGLVLEPLPDGRDYG